MLLITFTVFQKSLQNVYFIDIFDAPKCNSSHYLNLFGKWLVDLLHGYSTQWNSYEMTEYKQSGIFTEIKGEFILYSS